MVDLCGAFRRVHGDVVQAAANGQTAHQEFANMTLGPWRFEQADQQDQWDKPA